MLIVVYTCYTIAESGSGLYEESGEALTIIDKYEAWVFHILPDDSGKSAVWAAQRLRDNHIAVVANRFIIRNINFTDSDYFMYSNNIIDVAYRNKFITTKDKTKFDFTLAYAPDGYEIPANTGGWNDRRTWRVFIVLNPSANWSALQDDVFPFSVPVDQQLAHNDIFQLNRDYFQGTDYDLTQDIAAGPYKTPTRYDRNTDPRCAGGYYERAISLHRTTYSFVAQSRYWLPDSIGGILWFAQHTPHTSLFVPIYTASSKLPESYTRGTIYRLTRDSSWWSYATVSNYADKMFMYIHRDIVEQQYNKENDAVLSVHAVDQQALQYIEQGQYKKAQQYITDFTVINGDSATDRWWLFFDYLLTKYRDGQRVLAFEPPVRLLPLFYPATWLQSTGYYDTGDLPQVGIVLPEPEQPPHPHHVLQTQQLESSYIDKHILHGNSFDTYIQMFNGQHDKTQSKLLKNVTRTVQRVHSKPIHPAMKHSFVDTGSIDILAEDVDFDTLKSYRNKHDTIQHSNLHTIQSNFTLAYTLLLCIVISVGSFFMGMKYQRKQDYTTIR